MIKESVVFEGSFAEVVQLVAGMKFRSFLTPDMASKNDARHDIDLFRARITADAKSDIAF